MMSEDHPSICNICGAALTNFERGLNCTPTDAEGKPGIPFARYEAWCPSCEIYLTADFEGKKSDGWFACKIDSESIGSMVSAEEFEEMENKITSHKGIFHELMNEDWVKFKKIKKSSDVLLHRINEDGEKDGFILKRGDFFVGSFIPIFMYDQDFGENDENY